CPYTTPFRSSLKLLIFLLLSLFGFLLKVDEDIHVILEDLGGLSDGVLRSNTSICPDIQIQAIIIGRVPESSGFDRIIHLADRRVNGINRNVADVQIFVYVLVGTNVTPSGLDPNFHANFAAFIDGADMGIRIQNIDLRIGLNIRRLEICRLSFMLQVKGLWMIDMKFQRDLFQIHYDVRDVFTDAGNGRKLVQDPIDLDGRNCSAFD